MTPSGTFTFSGSGELLSEELVASSQLRLSGSHASRWIAPAVLAWLALIDVVVQDTLSVASIAGFPLPIPEAVITVLEQLIGSQGGGKNVLSRITSRA